MDLPGQPQLCCDNKQNNIINKNLFLFYIPCLTGLTEALLQVFLNLEPRLTEHPSAKTFTMTGEKKKVVKHTGL